MPCSAIHGLCLRVVVSECVVWHSSGHVLDCLQLIGEPVVLQQLWKIPLVLEALRVEESCVWSLKLEAILVAELQLLQYLQPGILLNVFQVLECPLRRRVVLLLLENGLQLFIEVKLVELLQLLLHESFFLGLRTALGGRIRYVILSLLLLGIFVLAFCRRWQLRLLLGLTLLAALLLLVDVLIL